MRTVFVIGAGQLGSRHLQALKKVADPLSISVIDPDAGSLKTAQERYESFDASGKEHRISYYQSFPEDVNTVDVAIVASNANVRKAIVETIAGKFEVKYLVLEKLLFQKEKDYHEVAEIIGKKKIKTWVNCPMRTFGLYRDLCTSLAGARFTYVVSGSKYGLVTNAIHYLDHMVYFAGSTDFSVDTAGLDPNPIEARRKGYLELNGSLTIRFKNNSIGMITCFADGTLPVVVEIQLQERRYIFRETENKVWLSSQEAGWQWSETEHRIPFQSERTTELVNDLLKNGTCSLVPYEESAKIHLQLLEPLRRFLNNTTGKKFDYYPFT